MKRLVPRLLLAVVLVVAIHSIAYKTKNAEIGPPGVDLNEMSLTLGDWKGHSVEMDKLIFDKTRADLMVNRQYEDTDGNTIGVTTSVFSDWHAGFEHHPRSCYNAAGYRLVEEAKVQLERPGRPDFFADVYTYELGGERIHVLFWYLFGDQQVADRSELGQVRWNLPRGKPLPPLIKVMVQTEKKERETAKEQLKDFAEHVLSFIDGPADSSIHPQQKSSLL